MHPRLQPLLRHARTGWSRLQQAWCWLKPWLIQGWSLVLRGWALVQKGWAWFVRIPFVQRWGREMAALGALAVVLLAPFVLKPAQGGTPSRYDRRLVILTPHNEKIRHEFGRAFAQKWQRDRGEVLHMDWRVAGTSEIALMLRSDYAAAFERHWTWELGRDWSPEVAAAFGNSKIVLPKPGATTGDMTAEVEARKVFLDSQVGIGVDLFFGGGAVDYEGQARAGFLVPVDATGKHGVKPLMKKHPEWFKPEVLPQSMSGESFYDKEGRWVGTCLSSMGIFYNKDVLARLGIEKEPSQWSDLADPRLKGQIALSDPNKSGTVTKSLEQLIQQQMQAAVTELLAKERPPFKTEDEVRMDGVRLGWERGIRLIQRISANARYFTDNATKIPLEVSQGDAAAGMCIDFYGRSYEEQVRKADGFTRVAYVTPLGGSSIGVDPVGMLRGAPEPEAAAAFMEFLLSDEGQRLWNFRPGAPGGPARSSLRRLPVRMDFYTAENRQHMTDAEADPQATARAFQYHPEWTGHLFSVVRFVVKVMCVETHEEQKRAWDMLVAQKFPPRATAVFEDMGFINYQAALDLAIMLGKKDKIMEARKARELSVAFRNQYRRAYELARDSR